MAKIRYTIRLYRLHDLDLITFVETHEFNIISAIYSSLTAFAKGEAFVIEIPPRRQIQLPKLSRVYTKALVLDTEVDQEAIELLNKIGQGYRNNFLKNLLRLYLCNPLSEEFFKNIKRGKNDEVLYETPQSEIEERTELFNKKFNIFKANRKVVKAGRLRKRTPSEPVETEVENQQNVSKKKEPINTENTNKIKFEEAKQVDKDKNKNIANEYDNTEEEIDTNIVDDKSSEDESDSIISSKEADEITSLFQGLEGM